MESYWDWLPPEIKEEIDEYCFELVGSPRNIKKWTQNRRLHRDYDRPAVVHAGGTTQWYRKGFRHRDDDKPSLIYNNGDKEWWLDGRRHRDSDRPAVIYKSGRKEWWINGVMIQITGPD